jgi:hypothetical protein
MGSYVRAGFIIEITLLTAISTTLIQQVYAAIGWCPEKRQSDNTYTR